MKKLSTMLLSIMMVFVLGLGLIMPSTQSNAATVRINKKSLDLEVGASVTLKMTGTSKAVNWSSSNEKVAVVSNRGKVTGVDAGNATIFAKIDNKRYSCKVTVLPEFEVDEERIAEELDNRRLTVNGQDFVIDEEEVSEVKILSNITSKDKLTKTVKAVVYIDRTIAIFKSNVTITYSNDSNGWKVKKVTFKTVIDEFNLEGTWTGDVDVTDSKNLTENREISLEIYDVKEDGQFSAEASFIGGETDVVELAGVVDFETGDLFMDGISWISEESEIAKSLSGKGRVFSIYASMDISNDAYVTNQNMSAKNGFTDNLTMDKSDEDDKDSSDDTDGRDKEDQVDQDDDGFEYDE